MNTPVGGFLETTFSGRGAAVACRQLGLPLPARVLPNGQYGTGSGRMWINHIDCHGDEERLEDCPHGLYGNAPIYRSLYVDTNLYAATYKCTPDHAVAIECGFTPPASEPGNAGQCVLNSVVRMVIFPCVRSQPFCVPCTWSISSCQPPPSARLL